MSNAINYFELARTEEKQGRYCSALLFYISSFCDSFNSKAFQYPCGATAKIRNLQKQLLLTDEQLLSLVHSYGPLTDWECRNLLHYSIYGFLSGIKSVLSGGDANYGY